MNSAPSELGSSSRWIYSAWLDLPFILAPPILTAIAVILFPEFFASGGGLSPTAWIALVLSVDVAHVYSTLYRTYFDRAEFEARRALYTWAPLACWIAGVVLYSFGAMVFWRVLAYLAVFHFVRQQYGFMMLYARKDGVVSQASKVVDTGAIYLATAGPLAYWHTNEGREFHWFIDGDFLVLPVPWLGNAVLWIEALFLVVFLAKETKQFIRSRKLNWQKHLVVWGTAISWFTGIVLFNGDLAFTATNVLAHGIPYMALIWAHGRAKKGTGQSAWLRFMFRRRAIPLFVSFLILIAYIEELLWDGWIWRDHLSVFPLGQGFTHIQDFATLTWVVPLLALPQATHYVLDGFIWKRSGAVVSPGPSSP